MALAETVGELTEVAVSVKESLVLGALGMSTWTWRVAVIPVWTAMGVEVNNVVGQVSPLMERL
jgi:hypothetical protein